MQRQMFRKGGEALKPIPAGNKGLPNLPKEVRNRMGYMEAGGAVPPAPMVEMPPIPEAAIQPPMMPGEAMAATLPEDPMRDTLAAVQQNLATLDEADNAEDMINAIRGNELPLEARYAELAELVGPEDAKQTPESVLALVQPTILMSLDEGIGALAQEEMDVPVEGPMAQGIMSTVAPPADPGPPMPMPMGAPPANFNQGGLVRRGDNQPVQYFQDANTNRVAGLDTASLEDLFKQRQDLYQNVLGGTAVDLEEQKRLARAQMLFDIAQTGLAFAAPMPGEKMGMSPAQRLALAATTTQLPQTIGARAAALQEVKNTALQQERAVDLAALQAAEAEYTAGQKTLSDLAQIQAGKDAAKPMLYFDGTNYVSAFEGSALEQELVGRGFIPVDKPDADALMKTEGYTVRNKFTFGGQIFEPGDKVQLSALQVSSLPPDAVSKSEGVQIVTQDDGSSFAIDLVTLENTPVLGPSQYKLQVVDNVLVAVQPSKEEGGLPTVVELTKKNLEPEYRTVIDTRTGQETVIDINNATDVKYIDMANAMNAEAGTTIFKIRKMATATQPQPKSYKVGNDLVLSYDGRTYVDKNGVLNDLPVDSVPLSDTIAFEVAKNQQLIKQAGAKLDQLDEDVGLILKGGTRADPTAVSAADQGVVIDAMRAAREGTGPYAAFSTFMSNTLGGLVPITRDFFKDTQENRQYLRAIRVLGRSALVVNPRFPVAEMATVGELFPDPDRIFANPEAEASKFQSLKQMARAQLRRNLEVIEAGQLTDQKIKSQILANNFEIERLLNLLGSVPMPGQAEVDPAVSGAIQNIIQQSKPAGP
jgi:hypothetical protein